MLQNQFVVSTQIWKRMQILHETVIETHKTHLFINIRFLFDLLLSEYLNNKLLKLCELTFSKCSFVRVARWFDFTHFITENGNSQQHIVLYAEISRTPVF